MSLLRRNIRRWLTRNGDYYRNNVGMFGNEILDPDSNAAVYAHHKDVISGLRVLDYNVRVHALVDDLVKNGYSGRRDIPLSRALDVQRAQNRARVRRGRRNMMVVQGPRVDILAELEGVRNLRAVGARRAVLERIMVADRQRREATMRAIVFKPDPIVNSVFRGALLNIEYETVVDVGVLSGDEKVDLQQYECRDDNVSGIARAVLGKIGDAVDYAREEKMLADGETYSTWVQVYFIGYLRSTGSEVKSSTVMLRSAPGEGIGVDRIEDLIRRSKAIRGTHNTDNYTLFFSAVRVVLMGHGVSGGCDDRKHTSKVKDIDARGKTFCIKNISPYSVNDNCLIACFNTSYGVKGDKHITPAIREKINVPSGPIALSKIPMIAEYYGKKYGSKGFIVCDGFLGIIAKSGGDECKVSLFEWLAGNDDDDVFGQTTIIQLIDGHYTLLKVSMKKKQTCEGCGVFFTKKHSKSSCLARRTYMAKGKMVSKQKGVDEALIDVNRMVFWDLETFQPDRIHVPYASGYHTDGEYQSYYGPECMDRTMDDFLGFDNKIITAYNGSSFDFYFLLAQLIKRGADITGIVINSNKLMKFTYEYEGKSNTIFDLYLFLSASLAKACESFKTEISKGSLDHSMFKVWQDTERHRDEVEIYLRKDVEALKELFIKFNTLIQGQFKINVTKFYTSSHLSYYLWTRSKLRAEAVIEIPNEVDKYRFIRQSIFAGRCYPQQEVYTSGKYNDVKEGKASYEDVLKSGDFIFNADATSLYSASMSGNDLVPVEYPTGLSRWSETPEAEFKDGKMGFYTIRFSAPKDLRVPILPRRKIDGDGIEWSLVDGEGVYNSVDIGNAMEAGYIVEFMAVPNGCLVYDSKGKIFDTFINHFFQMKNDAEKEGNVVMRTVAKLFLNALYGKTLQRLIDTDSGIVSTLDEFIKFAGTHSISEFQILSDDRILVSGSIQDADISSRITKPCQLGSFVTAYSRRFMLYFMKEVDPTLKTPIFTYTDTDSLHLDGGAYNTLLGKGLIIPDGGESKLGYLTSDYKGDALIVYEHNIGPKCYRTEYVRKDGVLVDSTMKSKGIPSKTLVKEMYDCCDAVPVNFESLKKVGIKPTSEQKDTGVGHFTIVGKQMTRTFNKNAWGGMIPVVETSRIGMPIETICWYPKGYDFGVV